MAMEEEENETHNLDDSSAVNNDNNENNNTDNEHAEHEPEFITKRTSSGRLVKMKVNTDYNYESEE